MFSGRVDYQAAFNSVFQPIEKARGLPNLVYTDPAFFRDEQDRVFADGWTCAGVSADLPNPGDVKPVHVGGRPIVLVRARDGGVRAYHNVCPHRGALLVAEAASGSPVIRCPYHSWAYDLDGALVKTPEVGGPGVHQCDAITKDNVSLAPVRVREWLGFVFVDVIGRAPDFDEEVAPLMRRWADYDFSTLGHGGYAYLDVKANWKLAVENYAESYHLPWVHPDLNTYSPLAQHYSINIEDRFAGPATRQYVIDGPEHLRLPKFPNLPKELETVGEYPWMFPNLLLGVQPDHLFAIVLEPLSESSTREHIHVFFIGDAAQDEDHEAARADTLKRWIGVFEEDVWAVERMQAGRASPGFDGGRMTEYHDQATILFMRRFANRFGAQPDGPQSVAVV